MVLNKKNINQSIQTLFGEYSIYYEWIMKRMHTSKPLSFNKGLTDIESCFGHVVSGVVCTAVKQLLNFKHFNKH